jgi:hypothetical protein
MLPCVYHRRTVMPASRIFSTQNFCRMLLPVCATKSSQLLSPLQTVRAYAGS